VVLTYTVADATEVNITASPGGALLSRHEAHRHGDPQPITAMTTFTIQAVGSRSATKSITVAVAANPDGRRMVLQRDADDDHPGAPVSRLERGERNHHPASRA